jgi:ABC-type multidrug transport system fused ATPase/permease subunit
MADVDNPHNAPVERITVRTIIWTYIRENPTHFIIYCMIVLCMPINEVLLPQVYGKILDGINSKANISPLVMKLVFLFFLMECAYITNSILDAYLYPRMIQLIRRLVLNNTYDSISNNFIEIDIGAFSHKLTKFPMMMYSFIEDLKDVYVPFVVIYIYVLITLLHTDRILCGIIAVLIGIVLSITVVMAKTCTHVAFEMDDMHNDVYDQIDDVIRNLLSVVVSSTFEEEVVRIEELHEKYAKLLVRAQRIGMFFKITFIACFVVAAVFFSRRCTEMFATGSYSTGVFVGIFIMLLYIFGVMVRHVTNLFHTCKNLGIVLQCLTMFNYGYVEHIEDVSAETNEISNDIAFYEVDFSYGKSEHKVLDKLSVYISPNQKLGVIGEIGSGKSTIGKILLKLVVPQEGIVAIGNASYAKMSSKRVRAKIGYVYQQPVLFNRTVVDNIIYGNKDKTVDDVVRLVKDLEIEHIFADMPLGLHSIAGKNGGNFSGGQRQVIMICRAIMKDPDVFVFDEATSAIDADTKVTVTNIIRRIFKNKTMIFITHDLDMLGLCDRVVLLKNGKVSDSDVRMSEMHLR